jgi:hypothetical protein
MSTNTKTRTLQPVHDPAKPRTETEDKLWQALRTTPGSTAAALSTAAGIGRSTAPKILTRWEKDGLVTRTTGIADGGSRAADRWSITADDQPTTNQPTTDQPADDQTTTDQTTTDQPADDQTTNDQPTSDQPTDDQPKEKPARLAPGALRGMVEDFLRDNPGEFSPNAIGKALARSSGAVSNALETLAKTGYATRTSERPKKYSLAATTAPSE